ncbi:putative methyltransferase, chloroplastic [Porphyridium purpureum]|uniref:Putative methyltransferase, chloroplastic n=1 Tax=Porphyridium purpureum TaxID=35688 RepID=A0A5J4YMF4_PORPP|nr:putative methyltransferase, chloroplastic [Porphyridium purpureum]|eukprot:POR4972..scf244_11
MAFVLPWNGLSAAQRRSIHDDSSERGWAWARGRHSVSCMRRAAHLYPLRMMSTRAVADSAAAVPWKCPNCGTRVVTAIHDQDTALPQRGECVSCPECYAPVARRTGRGREYVYDVAATPNSLSVESLFRLDDVQSQMQALLETELQLLPLARAAPRGKSMFQSALVSFAYERGWRAQFEDAGFLGPQREYERMMQFLGVAGGLGRSSEIKFGQDKKPLDVALDLSCGSGFMARMLSAGGYFSHVVGVDSSEAMLRESVARCTKPALQRGITWIRADAQRLPLTDNSVDLIHAGAALHCWQQIPDVLAEVHRTLKPDGGKFFATTFAEPNVGPAMRLRNFPVISQMASAAWSSTFRAFANGDELIYMCRNAGFAKNMIQVERIQSCLILTATKT